MSKPIKISYIWNRENVESLFEASYKYQFENSGKRFIGWLFIALLQYGIVLALKKDAFAIALFGIKNPEVINNTNSSIPTSLKMIAREIESLSHQKAVIKTKIKSHLNILFPELEHNVDIFRKSILNILLKFPSAKKIAVVSVEEIQSIIDSANHTGKKVKFNADTIINLAKNSIASSNEGIEIALVNYINQLFIIENSINN